MVRAPYIDTSTGMKKGAWSHDEDCKLRAYIHRYGHPSWRLVPICAGLARCGKSCRLRWLNYLKPGIRRGNFTQHEEDLIIKLQSQLGNKWSVIAAKLPGRTDNEIKNRWHSHLKKHVAATTAVHQLEQVEQRLEAPVWDDELYGKLNEEDFRPEFQLGQSSSSSSDMLNGGGGIWGTDEIYDCNHVNMDFPCLELMGESSSSAQSSSPIGQPVDEDEDEDVSYVVLW